MTIKYNHELLAGLLFAILAGIGLLLLPSQVPTLETTAITARTFPLFALIGLLASSAGLFVQGLRLPKKNVSFNRAFRETLSVQKELRSLLFCLFLVLYSLLFSVLGFILDTLLLVCAILRFYHSRNWKYYAIACLVIGLVYAVFTYFLNVNLPTLL